VLPVLKEVVEFNQHQIQHKQSSEQVGLCDKSYLAEKESY
jgi:hypothetical protein